MNKVDPPVSAFSLSLYRHPFLYTLFSSRFTLIINNKIKLYDTPPPDGYVIFTIPSSIPRQGSLKEAVELWDREGIILLLLRDNILGTQSSTRPDVNL